MSDVAAPSWAGPAWSNTPAALLADPALSDSAKLTACALGVHTDAAFTATVSRSRLAATVAISLARVKRGLRELIASGWLQVEYRKASDGQNEINRYRWNYRQAGLALERMRRGRAVQPMPQQASRGRVAGDPRGRAKAGGEGRASSGPHTNSSYTNNARARESAGLPPEAASASPASLADLIGPDSAWGQAKRSLKGEIPPRRIERCPKPSSE